MKDDVVFTVEDAEQFAIILLGRLVHETKRLWLIKSVDVHRLDYSVVFECPGVSLSLVGDVQITSNFSTFGMTVEEISNKHFSDIMDRYKIKTDVHES